MSDVRTPSTVLADWRSTADSIGKLAHRRGDADLIRQICDDFSEAAHDWLTWISERDAMLRSGKGVQFFRSRFHEWEMQGYAEMRGRMRYYVLAVVPMRADVSAARQAGLRGERPERRRSA